MTRACSCPRSRTVDPSCPVHGIRANGLTDRAAISDALSALNVINGLRDGIAAAHAQIDHYQARAEKAEAQAESMRLALLQASYRLRYASVGRLSNTDAKIAADNAHEAAYRPGPRPVEAVLQRIYDSEINFTVRSPLWDGGIDWALGDEANGYKAEGNERTVAKAVERLAAAVVLHYPESDFAKWNDTAPK